MKLDDWSTTKKSDGRRKRLAIGYSIGGLVVALFMSLVAHSAHGRSFQEDEYVDVSLAKAPDLTQFEEPEPESTPAPKPKPKKKRSRKARRKLSGPPKGIPDTVPEEADPSDSNPYDGDVDDLFDSEGDSSQPQDRTVKKRVNYKPKPKTVKLPKPPVFQSEKTKTPAVALYQPLPTYPDTARSSGLEAVVIVRFVIGSDGSVKRIKFINDPKLFKGAIVIALKSWKFKPAIYDEKPIAVWKTVRFPFRLR